MSAVLKEVPRAWDIDGSGRMTDEQRKMLNALTAEVAYDAETGVFHWRRDGRGRAKRAGAIVGSAHSNGYVRLKILGQHYYAHRVAWALSHGYWPCAEVDHINGVRNDNRLCNLREATRTQNHWNTIGIPSRRKYSQHKGVTREHRSDKWLAQIQHNGLSIRLGLFDTEEEAANAYRVAAKQMRGGFAKW